MDYPNLLEVSVGFLKLPSTHPIHIVVLGNFTFNNISFLLISSLANIDYSSYQIIMPWSQPLCKAASYEPRIAILGIWGDTWLTRGKYGIYVAIRGSYGGLTGVYVERNFKMFKILPRKISPFYCRVSYVAVTRIPSLVLRNTWHYVIIWRRKF